MNNILFGPAGIGKVKTIEENFKQYNKAGIKAAEIPFTYGIFIKKHEDIIAVKSAASKFGIKLSIHAPYWINLNSKEAIKIEQSKQRILGCCEIGHKLGAEIIVFHAGFYGGMDRDECYQNIKKAILEMQEEIKKNKWKVRLAPETMGKINVFGSMEEIARLVRETGCGFCIDFAHIEAREKIVEYSKIKELFNKEFSWHCHFSGIEYGEKGERKHIKTSTEKWKGLISNLPEDREIIVINESPYPIEDAIEGIRLNKSY